MENEILNPIVKILILLMSTPLILIFGYIAFLEVENKYFEHMSKKWKKERIKKINKKGK